MGMMGRVEVLDLTDGVIKRALRSHSRRRFRSSCTAGVADGRFANSAEVLKAAER